MAQLHMLLLILSHRHQIRLVQQDIRSHQAGVGKQAAVDVVRVLGRLILELGHPAQLTEHGVALQNPAQLRVLVHMALDEQGVLLRIQAAGDVLSQLLQSPPPQIRGILPDGDGMEVCHKVEAVVFLRPLSPVFHGTQIAAQGQIAGGLDAGEHPLFRRGLIGKHFTHNVHIPSSEFFLILAQYIGFRK